MQQGGGCSSWTPQRANPRPVLADSNFCPHFPTLPTQDRETQGGEMVLSPKSGTPHIETLGEVCSSESREGSGSFRLPTVALAVFLTGTSMPAQSTPEAPLCVCKGGRGLLQRFPLQGPMAIPTASCEHTCVLRAAAPALSAPSWPLCISEGVCGAQIWGDAYSGPPAERKGGGFSLPEAGCKEAG